MTDAFLDGLPAEFLRINARYRAWLQRLPTLLADLAERWSLTIGPHFPELSYNYVASATRADGTRCVLKVGRPNEGEDADETRTEMEALRLYDGRGACRLLECDPSLGVMLLERLEPGTMLVEVAEEDDDAATLIAAGVLRELWRPLPERHQLRSLESWFACFDRRRDVLRRGAGGYPAALFERATAMLRELLDSTEQPVVLHGDVHHFNVLRADRGSSQEEPTWLAIDPKGLAGDRYFDLDQFLLNPDDKSLDLIAHRLDLFCSELSLDRQRAQDWAFLHSMLQSCWSYEEGRDRWREHVARAEALLTR